MSEPESVEPIHPDDWALAADAIEAASLDPRIAEIVRELGRNKNPFWFDDDGQITGTLGSQPSRHEYLGSTTLGNGITVDRFAIVPPQTILRTPLPAADTLETGSSFAPPRPFSNPDRRGKSILYQAYAAWSRLHPLIPLSRPQAPPSEPHREP